MTELSSRRELAIRAENPQSSGNGTGSDPMERYLDLLATTAAIQEISRATRIMSEAARQEARWVRETIRSSRKDMEDEASNR